MKNSVVKSCNAHISISPFYAVIRFWLSLNSTGFTHPNDITDRTDLIDFSSRAYFSEQAFLSRKDQIQPDTKDNGADGNRIHIQVKRRRCP